MGHYALPSAGKQALHTHLPPALCAFPSPASATASLSSPVLDNTLDGSLAPSAQQTPRYDLDDFAGAIPTEPGRTRLRPLMSPPANEPAESDMNLAVGGALAPTSSKPPTHPPARFGPGLRLPSFDDLGIAAPHPDRYGVDDLDRTFSCVAREAMHQPFSAPHLHASSPGDVSIGGAVGDRTQGRSATQCLSPARAIRAPVANFIETLTPPAEHPEPGWKLIGAFVSAPTDSSTTEQRVSAPALEAGGPDTESAAATLPTRTVPADEASAQPRAWYDGAVEALLANVSSAPVHNTALKIISHALPSPSTNGHVFPSIISRINDSAPVSPSTPLTWINVFHAIPGRFNLADLPTSPPSTPGPAVGGDDYFTQKVFDSAVSISDYQDDLSSLPRSPRPIVPPGTVDVSIVERYIPPSSSNEFADMFNPNGPSILVDRLVELSSNNGSLVFIYPNRDGAHTFMNEYLGPILDPVLRTIMVVHGLSSDLSRTLGRMSAVDALPDHETLHRRVASLCSRLTQRATAAQRFSGRRPHLTLSYASKEWVRPSRETWSADWWTKQEKPRVRDAVKRYSQEAQTRRSNEHAERTASSTELLQEVLKGVCEKPYPSGQEPENGIEVSVFVIKRSE